MLCSNCSRVITPIVVFDIDGTLGDYHGHFIDFAQNYLNKAPIGFEYDGVGAFRDWFCFAFSTDATTFRTIKLAYRQGGMKRTMPPWSDMPGLVRWVKKNGCDVWLATTRPYMRLDNVDPDTRFWLEKHDVPYDGLLYDEDKYEVLARNVDKNRVIAVIDDLPEQYDAAGTQFGRSVPILKVNPYNRGITRSLMVSSSGGIWEVLQRRLRYWRSKYN